MSADIDKPTDATEGKAKPARPRKAKGGDRQTNKRSLNLSLSHAVHERLAIHALREDISISDLVSRLAEQHLREFHITRTPTREGEAA